jgi:hypothetical protein
LASQEGHLEIVNLFLDVGADMEAKMKVAFVPLLYSPLFLHKLLSIFNITQPRSLYASFSI